MTVLQTSSILACLCIGLVSISFWTTELNWSSVKPAYLYKFVFINDGATQLQRTPNLASSTAADLVSISIPAFDIQ